MPEYTIESQRSGYISGKNIVALILRLFWLTPQQARLGVSYSAPSEYVTVTRQSPDSNLKIVNDRWVYTTSRPLESWELECVSPQTIPPEIPSQPSGS
jgi:hypothetical protein